MIRCSLFTILIKVSLRKRPIIANVKALLLLHSVGVAWSLSFQPVSQRASTILCGAIYRVGDQYWAPHVNTSQRLFDIVTGEILNAFLKAWRIRIINYNVSMRIMFFIPKCCTFSFRWTNHVLAGGAKLKMPSPHGYTTQDKKMAIRQFHF